MSKARFFCKTGPLAGEEYQIGSEATIGRGEQNTITLSPEVVAEEHARIYYDEGGERYFLENRTERGGTQIDGLAVGDTMPLRELHVITLGGELDFIFQQGVAAKSPVGEQKERGDETQIGTDLGAMPDLPGEDEDRTRVGGKLPAMPDLSEETAGDETRVGSDMGAMPELPDAENESTPDEDETDRTRLGDDLPGMPDLPGEASGTASSEETEETDKTQVGGAPGGMPVLPDEPSEKLAAESEASASPYELEITIDENPDSETHALRKGETTIGRSSDCDIPVDDRGVSREHARLIVDANGVRVEDMGSKNFTFVNGERLSGPTEIAPGAEIHFGLQIKAVLRRANS